MLEKVLGGVLFRAVCFKFELDNRFAPVELEEDMRARASERLDISRHMDVSDA